MQQRLLGPLFSGFLISVLFCTACGGGQRTSSEARPSVVSPSVTTFTAGPPSITKGEAVALSWAASDADSVTISPDIGKVNPAGSIIFSPKTTTSYTAVASKNGVSGAASTLTITVGDSSPAARITAINHFVIMIQENRSFDNYFGKLNDYRGAKGLPQNIDGLPSNASNLAPDGSLIPAFHLQTVCTENVSPLWSHAHKQFNFQSPTSTIGKMDGFARTAVGLYDKNGKRTMGYYTSQDLPYYAFMASQFATSNRWFSPVLSKSITNRLYDFAATSAGYTGNLPSPIPTKTIFHLLEGAGISWKVYVTDPGATYMSDFQPFATQHSDKIVPASQFSVDADNGNLPAVAWIESGYDSGRDEHPNRNIQKGAAYVAQTINSLMQSPSWSDSVFILTYDEGGGLYDHVPPPAAAQPDGIRPLDLLADDPIADFDRDGLRVPLIVISPFTRPHYVSQTPMDHTAILKMIETRFHLPSLTARDASQPDMSEFFDFDNVPWRVPPIPPDQPADGPCYFDRLP